MLIVMAMEDKRAFEGSELHADGDARIGSKLRDVLLLGVIIRWDLPGGQVHHLLMRLQVNVDRVPPTAGAVGESPLFSGAQSWAGIGDVLVIEATIHGPSAVFALELEGAAGRNFRIKDFHVWAQGRVGSDGGVCIGEISGHHVKADELMSELRLARHHVAVF